MRVAVGSDHAGFPLKATVIAELQALGHEVLDLGDDGTDPNDDYPDFAKAVSLAVQAQRAERGVLICGSGVGASAAANKVRGIRSALCHDTFSARQGVEDDDMNVLALGARVIGPALAKELVQAYMTAKFSGLERHVRRLGKITAMEEEFCQS
jgi:RpiB/LacA/LacB family sugar-phosphate isomerase